MDVFVDRDGTLIEEIPYLFRPDQVRPLPGVLDGLRALADAGCRLFLVSNQSGLARGHFTVWDLKAVDQTLDQLLASRGLAFTGKRYCPHGPQDGCPCRKPQPGMLLELAREHQIDLERAWMIGDKCSDVDAGTAAGCRAVLVRTGCGLAEETRLASSRTPRPTAVVDDFRGAVVYLLQR